MIQYLKKEAIDLNRWDAALAQSPNRLIYAESNYLQHMCDDWHALVLNDYEAILPIPIRRKWGIAYMYQPAFFQQGGLFAATNAAAITPGFLDALAREIKFAETTMHAGMEFPDPATPFQIKTRKNFLLPLSDNYEAVADRFPAYTRQRIRRAEKNELHYTGSHQLHDAVQRYRHLYQQRLPAFTDDVYDRFEKLCQYYNTQNRLYIREVYAADRREILASVILLKDDHRLYNLASSVTEKGKKMLANYCLFDQVIREFAASGLTLDFEGSDVPGIAYFYEKFASHQEAYYFIRLNQLPAPLKWLKG